MDNNEMQQNPFGNNGLQQQNPFGNGGTQSSMNNSSMQQGDNTGTPQQNPFGNSDMQSSMNNQVQQPMNNGVQNPMNNQAQQPMNNGVQNPMNNQAQQTAGTNGMQNPMNSSMQQGMGNVQTPMNNGMQQAVFNNNMQQPAFGNNGMQQNMAQGMQNPFMGMQNPMQQGMDPMQAQPIPNVQMGKTKKKRKPWGCLIPILIVIVLIVLLFVVGGSILKKGTQTLTNILGANTTIYVDGERCYNWMTSYAGVGEVQSDETFDEYYITNYSNTNCMVDVAVYYSTTPDIEKLIENWKNQGTALTKMYLEANAAAGTYTPVGSKSSQVIAGDVAYVMSKQENNCYTYGLLVSAGNEALFITLVSPAELDTETVETMLGGLLNSYISE